MRLRRQSVLSQTRALTTKNSAPFASRSWLTRLGIVVGMASLPVTGFLIYDRMAELPEELRGLNFPFTARFAIRRALCRTASLDDTARHLDTAMQRVLSSGLGSASPESTALVLYLARRYLEAADPRLMDLEAAHLALTYKPHVGESIREERARLELSFRVAERLCRLYEAEPHRNLAKVHFFASKSLEFLNHGPSYLQSAWTSHPLRSQFTKYMNTQ